MYAIETINLTKYYGKNKGISNVDLKVEEGEFFGFIGPNGAGKSTTIRTLLNFIYPTSGSASILGMDIVRESNKLKENVRYVPSEVNYYKHMKVKDILNYADTFNKEKDSERLDKLCEVFEVDTKKLVGDLSLGNKKKIAIIQALLSKPKLLILDEPTNGLDPLMQKRLFDVLQEENKNGTTIFFSSHNLVEVQKYCHRVAIIRDGEIIEVKNVEELVGINVVRVTIKTDEEIKSLVNTKGMANINSQDNETSFLYTGDINKLIKELSKYNLNELKIENPTLEDSFMSYYEEGDK